MELTDHDGADAEHRPVAGVRSDVVPALDGCGATQHIGRRGFELVFVTAAGGAGMSVLASGMGAGGLFAAVLGAMAATAVGWFFARPLLVGPARRTAAGLTALEGRVRALDSVGRRRPFESLSLPASDELCELAEAMKESLIEAHRDKLAAARIRREMTDRVDRQTRAATARLSRLAGTDALTGLANRRQFEELMPARFDESVKEDRELAVLAIDLDRFKELNDGYGHEAGDRALRGVAELLDAQFRDGDLAARLGGDEFVVVLSDVVGDEVDRVAHRLVSLFASSPAVAEFGSDWPGLSIGYSLRRAHGAGTWQELLRQSDLAMYDAKRSGRGAIRVFGGRRAA